MSVYNRKAFKKKCSTIGQLEVDNLMDESGYASFTALHNSTVEAPFLLERHCQSENCRNASNTIICGHESIGFNSTEFQTPGSSNSFNTRHNYKSLSLPEASIAQLEIVDDAEACKSPLPLAQSLSVNNQQQFAHKRRKSHHQPQTHHISPKRSKKILFPQPLEQSSSSRTRFYNGRERLDIVGMLSNTLPALDCILKNVDSPTLDVMTKVSEKWAQVIQKNRNAVERLQNHRIKMNLCKENTHPLKRGHKISTRSNHLMPFKSSNAIHIPNNLHKYKSASMSDTCALEEEKQRIKCPHCGNCSKVFVNSAINQTPTTRHSNFLLSQTLPHTLSFSERKATLTRFYSADELKNKQEKTETATNGDYPFGECIGVSCKFRFCVHCFCPPHPGSKCLVTDLGTPSKLMMPSEKVTPPKRNQKYDSKLSRKKSLKRLNF